MIVCLLGLLKTLIHQQPKLALDTSEHVSFLNNTIIDLPVRYEFQIHSVPSLASNLSRLLLPVQTKNKRAFYRNMTYNQSKLKFLSNFQKLSFEKKPKFLIIFNPLSANPTKWSNTLKQFVLSVFDYFVGLALKGLTTAHNKRRVAQNPVPKIIAKYGVDTF